MAVTGHIRRVLIRALAVSGVAALAACGTMPLRTAPPVVLPPVDVPSPQSQELAAYYQRLQDRLLAQGLLRTDGGGPDTYYDARMLAQNFVRIALYDEYNTSSGTLVARPTVSRLRRWAGPVTMSVDFGPTVPMEVRTAAVQEVATFAARLSSLTGVPIRQSSQGANFHVLFMNEDARRDAGDQLRRLIPGMSAASVNAVVNLPREQLCVVIGTFGDDGVTYETAVAVIRAEHPDLLRLSCIHEELAQGMGLANDSPAARPSIFNDDEEFGLLTTQDELMLRLLYDPRLTPGMTAAEAAPIVQTIATEYFAGNV